MSTPTPGSACKEAILLLAKQNFQTNPNLSQRQISASYDIPRSTLQSRLQGGKPRSESNHQKRKLQIHEEQALVQWILDLDRRGFPPQIIDVRRMANALLEKRGTNPPPSLVGKNWVSRFINAQPELCTKWNRKFHSQRAKCEDPATINAWFQRVEETPSPPGTPHGVAPQWTSETPRTIAQLEQQAQLVRNLLHRQSQSPSSQAIGQLIKGCQVAMNSAVILAEENRKLRTENQRRKQKQQYRRRYIAYGGVLQAQQGQFLVEGCENSSRDSVQDQEVVVRQRALPTCSGCGIQGHKINRCPNT